MMVLLAQQGHDVSARCCQEENHANRRGWRVRTARSRKRRSGGGAKGTATVAYRFVPGADAQARLRLDLPELVGSVVNGTEWPESRAKKLGASWRRQSALRIRVLRQGSSIACTSDGSCVMFQAWLSNLEASAQ